MDFLRVGVHVHLVRTRLSQLMQRQLAGIEGVAKIGEEGGKDAIALVEPKRLPPHLRLLPC